MGRSPCCDKLGLKKGPWTPEEDQKLLAYIEEHGPGNWRALPTRAGLQRCGKSCRLRWTNYLRPGIKRGKFSLQEEQTIIQLHALLGNRWSAIATHLPKRTDNEIKNYWNTNLKKRLTKMGIDPVTHKPKNDALLPTGEEGQRTKNAATLSHMAQWESARLEAEARLAHQTKPHSGTTNTISTNSSSTSTSTVPRCFDVFKTWQGVWPPSTSTPTTIGADSISPSGIGFGGFSSARLGSPTSTLSFSEPGLPVPSVGPTVGTVIEFIGNSNGHNKMEEGLIKEEEGNNHHQHSHNHSHYHHLILENSLSFSGSSGFNDVITEANNASNKDEREDDEAHNHNQETFMEGFTELLLGGAATTTNASGEKSQGGSSTDNNNNNNNNNDSIKNKNNNNNNSNCSDYYEDNKNYWNNILNLVNSPSPSPMF